MKKGKMYFADTPWGDLYLDEEFLSYGTLPMVFSLLDCSKRHYLAVCVSFRRDYEWLLITIESEDLINLIKDRVTLYQLLTKDDNEKASCMWRESSKIPECSSLVKFQETDLPEDMYLELCVGDYEDYINKLESEKKSVHNGYRMVDLCICELHTYIANFEPLNVYLVSRTSRKYCKIGLRTPRKGLYFSTSRVYSKTLRAPDKAVKYV